MEDGGQWGRRQKKPITGRRKNETVVNKMETTQKGSWCEPTGGSICRGEQAAHWAELFIFVGICGADSLSAPTSSEEDAPRIVTYLRRWHVLLFVTSFCTNRSPHSVRFSPDHAHQRGRLGLLVGAAKGVEHRYSRAHQRGRVDGVHALRHLEAFQEKRSTTNKSRKVGREQKKTAPEYYGKSSPTTPETANSGRTEHASRRHVRKTG